MKNHFFIGYFGNKRNEVEKIYNEIKDKLIDKEIIIEPFCGSSALSYYIWLNNKDKNYQYILNDNNIFIYQLYLLSKDEEKYNIFIDELKIMFNDCKNKEDYLKIAKKAKDEEDLKSYIYINKIYNIRPGLYPTTREFKVDRIEGMRKVPILDFIRNANIKFTNMDCLDIYNEYKSNNKAFIFLDPPYINAENGFYKNPTFNIYEYICNNEIEKEKAYIVLCLENNWIIKLLFKNKKSVCYDKRYETTKKITTHIIILNK